MKEREDQKQQKTQIINKENTINKHNTEIGQVRTTKDYDIKAGEWCLPPVPP